MNDDNTIKILNAILDIQSILLRMDERIDAAHRKADAMAERFEHERRMGARLTEHRFRIDGPGALNDPIVYLSPEQTEQIRRALESKNAFDSYRVDPGADGPALRPSRDIMFDTRPRDE